LRRFAAAASAMASPQTARCTDTQLTRANGGRGVDLSSRQWRARRRQRWHAYSTAQTLTRQISPFYMSGTHFTWRVSHFTCRVPRFTCGVSHFTCRVSHFTCRVLHFTCWVLHFTWGCYILHVRCPILHVGCSILHVGSPILHVSPVKFHGRVQLYMLESRFTCQPPPIPIPIGHVCDMCCMYALWATLSGAGVNGQTEIQ
jgi:hypothetical protein